MFYQASIAKFKGAKVLDMDINAANAAKFIMRQEAKGSSRAKQDKDNVPKEMFKGNLPLPWLQFEVEFENGDTRWVRDPKL